MKKKHSITTTYGVKIRQKTFDNKDKFNHIIINYSNFNLFFFFLGALTTSDFRPKFIFVDLATNLGEIYSIHRLKEWIPTTQLKMV
jgi:hypothetical protein